MGNTSSMSARDRIASILDDNSFVEIGAQVRARATDFNLAKESAPSDGVITGYGVVNGNLVYIYSQDASVMNGSIGEMHAKKIASIYDMALNMGAPVIGLIDCAGIRLQEATDALSGFGSIYKKMSDASGVVPQITAIYGQCGGGLAVLAELSDFVFMDEENGSLFVNSPNAIDGNYKAKLDTSSAEFMAEAGMIDYYGDEELIANGIRQVVSVLPANNGSEAIAESTDDLNRTCPDLLAEIADPALALADISDDGTLIEAKPFFAKDMVTAFIKIDGVTVGAVANRTVSYDEDGEIAEKFEPVLTPDGARKAAHFVKFCNAFGIAVLSLTSVKGYDSSLEAEKSIAKAVAELTYAFASADVPKVNVITGQAFGSSYVAMNSKSIGADLTYAWPDASIGMMDASEAVKIIYADELAGSEDVTAFIAEKTDEYAALQSSVASAAARGYVDTIINPCDTRKYIAAAFEMLFTKSGAVSAKKHGTV